MTETVNGGGDTVVATVNYTLPANVEALYMIGSGLTGTGSANADSLSAAADPTHWSVSAATISITSTTPATW